MGAIIHKNNWRWGHGFKQQIVYDDGMVGLTFDLE